MTKRITIIALLVAFVCVEASAQNRTHRRRGVILGGLAGAAIGAAIGDKGDNETAGALIGGAVGAVAGGTIGNQKDQRIEHNNRYHSGRSQYVYPPSGYQYGPYPQYRQPYYSPQTRAYPQPAPGLGPVNPARQAIMPHDVVAMVRGGMSHSMIIHEIQLHGIDHPLTVTEVIHLHNMGVSEPIIQAMQGAAPIAVSEETIVVPTGSYRLPPVPAEPYGPSVLGPVNGRK